MPPAKQLAKIVAGLLVIAALIIAFRVLPVGDWLRHFQTYVRGLGALGYVLYIVVYALCNVAFVPASILTLGAGAIFGFVGGTIVVVIGATLGATLSFLLARTVMRKRVEEMTANNARFRALDRAIASEGTKIVFLSRLAVVFPFTYINYAFGLTAIPLWRYVAATFIGILPATAAFVFVGAAATNAATTSTSSITKIIYIAGGVMALIVSVLIGRIATKAIKRAGVGGGE
ncbi:MAG TPA: TVP38/TMEM64 family protein [Thermoanaerobaculia bacterium]|nr:TVP38/TMEM64 family protein [Thermoanaerobaculia bacterium]